MRLVIAEKPSVAQSIARVLGAKERRDGYMEGNTYGELVEKTDAITAQFNQLSASIKSAETRLAEIAALKKHIINYSRTKEIYAAYRKAGYRKKFLEEHREGIAIPPLAKFLHLLKTFKIC